MPDTIFDPGDLSPLNSNLLVIVRSSGRWLVPLGSALSLLLLFFISIERRYQALWVGPAQDFCHVPMFAFVTLLIARTLRGLVVSDDARGDMSGILSRRITYWAVALGSVLTLLIEWVQPWFGRSCSLVDVSLGLIGVALAAVWLVGDLKLVSTIPAGGFWMRVVLTIILSWWPVERTGPVVADAAWSWLHYPRLAVDGSWWERRRWELDRGVTLTWHSQPAEPSHSIGFRFPAERPGSRAILWPVVSDWSAADWLEIELTVPTDRWPLLIALRDATEVTAEQSRYNRYEVLSAGRQLIRIPLRDLPVPADSPPIDLSHITMLILVNPDRRSCALELHRVEVVSDG
ncbi:MAG: hypothetical protein ACKOUR_10975 [Planctomycetota bacterium]